MKLSIDLFNNRPVFFDQIIKVDGSNHNIFIILDKVFSKLYFFSEKDLVSQIVSPNMREIQLN